MTNEERLNEISRLKKDIKNSEFKRNTGINFLPASIMLTGGGILTENNFVAALGLVSTFGLLGLAAKGQIDKKNFNKKLVKIYSEEGKHE